MEDAPDISWGCNIDSSTSERGRNVLNLTSQCAHLQDRTMALAKELASLKLVSDISLEEVDLAFFENNAKDKRYNRHTGPCLFRFFGNLRSIVVCVELVFWF
ncbi:BnaC06g31840D [Brassica napus]|uniref:BnaC06g31840D protein n=1 Tax=Brassica napus TaxID=3708 RepID=A0A078FB07_BRANA|nr:BnaC06g31840D [Brassica napus]